MTGLREDRFEYRTPPLRGVALTSPFMHNGCYATLEEAIEHHVRPRAAYATYDVSQLEPEMQAAQGLKPMEVVFDPVHNPVVVGPGSPHDISLTAEEIDHLVAFLIALTDPGMFAASALAPDAVPSGLPVDVPGPQRFPIYGSP